MEIKDIERTYEIKDKYAEKDAKRKVGLMQLRHRLTMEVMAKHNNFAKERYTERVDLIDRKI